MYGAHLSEAIYISVMFMNLTVFGPGAIAYMVGLTGPRVPVDIDQDTFGYVYKRNFAWPRAIIAFVLTVVINLGCFGLFLHGAIK